MREVAIGRIRSAVEELAFKGPDEVLVNAVEFDSRKVEPGTLFVPLTGGATDGHTYIQQAMEQGAKATLWSRSLAEAPDGDIAVIHVPDTLEAMQAIAAAYRRALNPIVIGITGSNGKTTTKDMTAQVLIPKYKVHKTQGNYNNEIGLPYTLLQMPADTEVVVCEMGMSGYGEIDALTQIALPDIAAITLIGESHLEHLGSRQGIAQAKMEIVNGLTEDGILFYPGAEPLLTDCLANLARPVQMVSFGFEDSFALYAYDLIEEEDRTYFRTNLDSNVLCTIPVLGAYNVSNALIALGIARQLSVPIEQAIFQLSQFELTENRLQWLQTPKGTRLLNDAYNASPTSMRAVIETLSKIEVAGAGRKIAVLGDMLELGEASAEKHRVLASAIWPEAIDTVYLFGPWMKALYNALLEKYPAEAVHYYQTDQEALIRQLQEDLLPSDVVLLKSSFGTNLLAVVEALVKE